MYTASIESYAYAEDEMSASDDRAWKEKEGALYHDTVPREVD